MMQPLICICIPNKNRTPLESFQEGFFSSKGFIFSFVRKFHYYEVYVVREEYFR